MCVPAPSNDALHTTHMEMLAPEMANVPWVARPPGVVLEPTRAGHTSRKSPAPSLIVQGIKCYRPRPIPNSITPPPRHWSTPILGELSVQKDKRQAHGIGQVRMSAKRGNNTMWEARR